MAALLVAQVIARFESGALSASMGVAVSCCESPTTSDETPLASGLSGGPAIVTPATALGSRTAYTLKCDTGAVTTLFVTSTVDPGTLSQAVVVRRKISSAA